MARKSKSVPKSKATKAKASSSRGGQSLGQKALIILAQFRGMGKDALDREFLMVLCRSTNLSSFKVTLSNEKKKGFVEFPGGKTVSITEKGLEKVPEGLIAVPTNDEELQDFYKKTLNIKGTPAKIFDFLRDGKSRTFEELAEHCGYGENSNKSSFRVMLSTLTGAKAANVVVKDDNGLYRLADKCFLEKAK